MVCLPNRGVPSFSFLQTILIRCSLLAGNTIQLAIAIARLFSVPRDTSFHIADRQALCSLLTFLLGAFLGRIGDHVGCRKRYWIVSATLLQAGFSLGAALTSHYGGQSSFANTRGDPSWNNVLGFCSIGFVSASLGLQANIGTRLGTQFATYVPLFRSLGAFLRITSVIRTVVLTTIWVQLMGDPKLFDVRHLVKTRDLKILAIVALIIGGFVSRALIDKIGASTTLGIGAAMRVLIALSWLFVPSKL
jgi:hypothetical protein